MNYNDFLESKKRFIKPSGFDCQLETEHLKPFQKAMVQWAVKKGKCGLYADTGLGKTRMQLFFADEIHKRTGGNVLILAPLAVSAQTKREGKTIGINVTLCRTQDDVKKGINITNYEMLHSFNADDFIGIVLDESSILKSYSGKVKQEIIDSFAHTPYKLSCSATPAPNDYEELGNQAEFLGVCTRTEMLSEFFVHDNGETQKWRLKGHAVKEFWKWVGSWGMIVKKPSDLGFDDSEYNLPPINKIIHVVESPKDESSFFVPLAQSLDERRKARKESLEKRVLKTAELVKDMENCLIWCDYNDESDLLKKSISGAVEVKGADTPEHKEKSLIGFSNNEFPFLVSKASICGFGMNWQHCNNIIFCGLSDSYERYYQAIRRCWRFGQKRTVNVHIIISESEQLVLENINRKEKEAEIMSKNMTELVSEIIKGEILNTSSSKIEYVASQPIFVPKWLKESGYAS